MMILVHGYSEEYSVIGGCKLRSRDLVCDGPHFIALQLAH